MINEARAAPSMDSPDTLSDAEISLRKEFLELGPEDLRRLREAAPVLRDAVAGIVEKTFTQDVMKYADPASLLQRVIDEGRLGAVAQKLIVAFQQQLEADIDRRYTERRQEIGRVHARIGLEPKWYLGALNKVQQRLADALEQDPVFGKDPARAWAAMRSLMKVVYYDMMVVHSRSV